jgi:signal transduction histidine kinase
MRADRKKMHEQLLISERMASVGTLAAGVAHEINNPLAILVANLELASEQLAGITQSARLRSPTDAVVDGSPPSLVARLAKLEQPLRDALEATERVRLIARDLKVFSHAGDEDRRGAVDIHVVLESSIRMASNEIRHRARLVRDYSEVPFVEGNEARLGQVFLNLIVNAAQAIPEGKAEANVIRIVTRSDGLGRVVVEIHDSGVGIPQAVMSRIFDAFFTTKPVGTGTGLGSPFAMASSPPVAARSPLKARLAGAPSFALLCRRLMARSRGSYRRNPRRAAGAGAVFSWWMTSRCYALRLNGCWPPSTR